MTPTRVLTTLVVLPFTAGAPYLADPLGVFPNALIQGADGNLYGTTSTGGSAGCGVVFCLNPAVSANVSFSSAATPAETSSAFYIGGISLNLTLSFAPPPGTVLTVLNNTGFDPVGGAYANLPNGGTIGADYNGIHYAFTASYSGGNGNDLTLTHLSEEPVMSSDVPLMPPWALATMAALLCFGGRRFLSRTQE